MIITIKPENLKEFVSIREYYTFKFQMRARNMPNILNCGRALQQHIVDIYVKIETERLDYFGSKETRIYTKQLQGKMDCGF